MTRNEDAPADRPEFHDGTAVTVVIPSTGRRPQLLRRAVANVLDQDHPGPIELIVVFDHVDIDDLVDVDVPAGRSIRTIPNTHPQGLAGGRNTGIDEASHPFLAFSDDDDYWRPTKVRKQFELWAAHPGAVAVATGMTVVHHGGETDRLPPPVVTFWDFLGSRIAEINSSSVMYRTADLRGRIGPVDEDLPAAYGEDYDLLLRAARHGAIHSVQEPLAVIDWQRASYFAANWKAMADGTTYLLNKVPEFVDHPAGYARMAGQIAFAHAGGRDRRAARVWAKRSLRANRRELRAYGALAVSWRLAPAGLLLKLVNRTGRGV
jgi:glycosyltransferase involved in cell wall biosynthesis